MKNEEFSMFIQGNRLDDELVMEIGKFSILWNCFERFKCNYFCSINKIKEISSLVSIDKEKQAELARVLNERLSWSGQVIPEYVKIGLHPGNAHQSQETERILMEQFIKQEGDDLRQGCLLVIHRIRNNLLHGLKCVEQLNDQLELFKAVNGVLESLDLKN